MISRMDLIDRKTLRKFAAGVHWHDATDANIVEDIIMDCPPADMAHVRPPTRNPKEQAAIMQTLGVIQGIAFALEPRIGDSLLRAAQILEAALNAETETGS